MGVVYEAIQLSLKRRVALKVLPSGTIPEERDIERFRREAQAAARLDHPNIVPIYAQGEERGTYYYAMKLVRGQSVDKVIREVRSQWKALQSPGRSTALTREYVRTAARLAMEAAQALEYAHSQGVIHRDIKPHNLILTPEGHPMITDFGLARFLGASRMTMSGEMMGTPAYMSPEQVRAQKEAIDHRTDIYSLGVTLYEMLALDIPFRGETREAVLRQILMEDPTPLRELNPGIPKDLETICHKAMEKDPDLRYQTAELFAHDLYCFLEGPPITSRPVGPLRRLYRRAKRRRALTGALCAAVAGVLLALAVAVHFGIQSYRTSRREPGAQRQAEQERGRTETERQTKEAETAARLEGQRPNFFADARLVATLTGHGNSVLSVAFSPDGKMLASGSARIKLWDVATQRELRTLAGRGVVAFSPDGRILASGSGDKAIQLWDVATGGPLRTLRGHDSPVYSVAFSPDGRTLASGSHDKTIRLWNVATGRELRTQDGHAGQVFSVAFSPDGETLASGGEDGTVRLWGVATGRALRTLTGHTSLVYSVTFGPDGRTLASGSFDKTINLWDVGTGRELRTLAGHARLVWSAAFSPDGKILASGSEDDTIKLWRVATGRQLCTLAGHRDGVSSVAFSPDGKTLASGGADQIIKLWDVVTGPSSSAR